MRGASVEISQVTSPLQISEIRRLIFLNCPEDTLRQRLRSRSHLVLSYPRIFNLPEFYHFRILHRGRADDDPAIIEARLADFQTKTMPAVTTLERGLTFGRRGLFERVSGLFVLLLCSCCLCSSFPGAFRYLER
jgi:hypothetical protein